MKKYLMLFLCAFFFLFIPNAFASNYCDLADESWIYKSTVMGTKDNSKETKEEKIVCCNEEGSKIWYCDSYKKKESKPNTTTNGCTLQDQTKWQYVTTSEFSERKDEQTDTNLVHCCSKNGGGYICDYYMARENQGGTSSGDVDGNNSSNNTEVDYSGLRPTFFVIGQIVRLLKILIPFIIIAYGAYDFFKAITGAKDDEIKKSVRSFLFRCVAGVCIFFLPAVIDLVFSWVDGWDQNYSSFYEDCFQCIWNVDNCK